MVESGLTVIVTTSDEKRQKIKEFVTLVDKNTFNKFRM